MTFFAKNMGFTERIIRIGLGIILVIGTLLYLAQLSSWLAILLVLTGLTLIVEGLLSWCPLKALLGWGTQYQQK